MFLIKKAPFEGRDNFGEFLNTRGLVHYGVEIGTHQGEFASNLLNRWSGFLTCVDPWENLPEYDYQTKTLETDGDRNVDYEITKERMLQFGRKATVLRSTSLEASKIYKDGSFCFVYIDGNHQSPHVLNDLETWWPKLGPGGILAGHDIIMPGWSRIDLWEHDIQNAVFQFASSRQLVVWLVIENGCRPWSYYIEKPI